jgi:hypothetical protein
VPFFTEKHKPWACPGPWYLDDQQTRFYWRLYGRIRILSNKNYFDFIKRCEIEGGKDLKSIMTVSQLETYFIFRRINSLSCFFLLF